MKEKLAAAIISAVNAYIQQEEIDNAFANMYVPRAEMSSWRLFKQQELMRARTDFRIKRAS